MIVLAISKYIVPVGCWPGIKEKVYYTEKRIMQNHINEIPLALAREGLLFYFCKRFAQ